MDRQSTTVLLLALLVLGGTVRTQLPSESPTNSSTVSNAGQNGPSTPPTGHAKAATAPVDLIARFFESRDPTVDDAGADAFPSNSDDECRNQPLLKALSGMVNVEPADWRKRLRKLADLSKDTFDVKFTIATVPDPIDSHVGWQFDPVIDAIQRAFEANGFVLDRFYFPWQGDIASPADPTGLTPPIHARFPGVLLFRSAELVPTPTNKRVRALAPDAPTPDRPELQVVLLVGETPTRGVHKIALARCLDIVAAWEAIKQPPCCRHLNVAILGPAFSGSSMSLRLALEGWSADARKCPAEHYEWEKIAFRIVSGRVQDLRNKPTLHFTLNKEQRDLRAPVVESTFYSTMLPSAVLNECMFNHYFERRNHVDRRQIALLVEANTVYGEHVSSAVRFHGMPVAEQHRERAAEQQVEWAAEQQPLILQ